jgi:excisionase family DNA binding protein
MITIPSNTNTGIRIPAWTPPEKPKKKPPEKAAQRITVSVQEEADMLGVHKDTLMVLVKAEEIRTIKIGRRILVSIKSLNEYVDGKITPGNSAENGNELQGKKE